MAENNSSQVDKINSAPFLAMVSQFIDGCKVVINRWASHGVKVGQRYLVYGLSKNDIIDPKTNEKLGWLKYCPRYRQVFACF